jgi:ribose-phosphate pyrophosphokinase
VDDICDTAGSLVAACQILRDHGAGDIYAAITHGLFSRDAIDKINHSVIKELVISDTVPLSDEKRKACPRISVVSVADMLSDVVEAIGTHGSVANVYDRYENK